jgi:putative ABC transport system permease protein
MAWLDSRLLHALSLEVGDKVELGNSVLHVSRVLISEPDFSGNIFNTAPRLMFNIHDLERTGLVVPGSRVEHRQLFAGEAQAIDAFSDWLKGNLRSTDTLQGVREARPELNTALERADRFLGLTALIAVLLSAVAIAISAQRFARRHRTTSALMRTFGAQQRDIIGLYIVQLAILGIAACVLGVALGYVGHVVVIEAFKQMITTDLPAVKLSAAWPGFTAGMLLIFSFALPPLYQLRDIPPGQVLRPGNPGSARLPLRYYTAAVVLFPALVLWQAQDMKLALLFLAGLALTLLALTGFAMVLLFLIERYKSHAGITVRIGLTYLTRRRYNTLTESVGFGLGLMAIIVLILVRTDLLDDWMQTLPVGTPNQFVINIQQDQIAGIEAFFSEESMQQPHFYPMIRARLSSVNGHEIKAENYEDPQTARLATRVFNLSWSNELQPGNDITAGKWWDSDTKDINQMSFDKGLARRMGIKTGDQLVFISAGETIDARVTSLRQINWGTFQPNFYAIMPPAALTDYPATYISSFYVADKDKAFINRLIRNYRNLTIIDVGQMINQVRSIMDRVTLVIEFVFLFTIIAGVLVMFATMQSTHDERMRDNAIMKTLGADRRQLRKILMVEFLFIGLMSSIIATVAANLSGYGISRWLMKMPWQFHMGSAMISIVIGTAAITGVGLLAFRQYHKMTANAVLNQA